MERPLGHFERYSLACGNTGYPAVVAFIAQFKTANASVAELLPSAIARLLGRYPLLSARIADSRTRIPRYVTQDVKPHQVIHSWEERVADGPAEILARELELGRKFEIETGPLWRVTVYGGAEQISLALCVNHVLADGIGVRNLFLELLQLVHPSRPLDDGPVSFALPPSLESTIDMRPSFLHLVRIISQELVLPHLPAFLRPRTTPIFPNPPPPASPSLPIVVKLVAFPPGTVESLKSAGKTNGIATLHPLLHTCALAALTLSYPGKPLKILSDTPVSLRDLSLGHPAATGNYVAVFDVKETLSLSSPFFDVALTYSAILKSPKYRRRAKGDVGMIAFIPDPKLKRGATRTGWEEYLEAKLAGPSPLRASIGISNLGMLDLGKWEESCEVSWAQTSTPMGTGLFLQAISVNDGSMSVSFVWTKGTLADEKVDQICSRFRSLVLRVSNSEVGRATRVGDLL